jgi:transcriptional regulator with XRE-family HTH domain
MVICDRLRELRQSRNLSQGDIERRTGMLRCYISRVENGHTVPTLETLEKLARALEVPLLPPFLRWRKALSTSESSKAKDLERSFWGKQWQGRPVSS